MYTATTSVFQHGSSAVLPHSAAKLSRTASQSLQGLLLCRSAGVTQVACARLGGARVRGPSVDESCSSELLKARHLDVHQFPKGPPEPCVQVRILPRHWPKISRDQALTKADANRRGRESVSLTPALSRCLSALATHLRLTRPQTRHPSLGRPTGGPSGEVGQDTPCAGRVRTCSPGVDSRPA